MNTSNEFTNAIRKTMHEVFSTAINFPLADKIEFLTIIIEMFNFVRDEALYLQQEKETMGKD